MINSGMTKKMNAFFGITRDLTYSSKANEQIQNVLVKANKINITHEHGDHVGGVIQTKYFNQPAPKTLITFQQANSLKIHHKCMKLSLVKSKLISLI